MNSQDWIKLMAAFSGMLAIVSGIVALFRGLKADGVVDFSAIAKGKVKTGSAGVLLLFFGTMIFSVLILHGNVIQTHRKYAVDAEPKVEEPPPVAVAATPAPTLANTNVATAATVPKAVETKTPAPPKSAILEETTYRVQTNDM